MRRSPSWLLGLAMRPVAFSVLLGASFLLIPGVFLGLTGTSLLGLSDDLMGSRRVDKMGRWVARVVRGRR